MDDRLRLYSQREVQEIRKTGRKIFGSPTPMFHPRTKNLPDASTLRGSLAEHAVAASLNLLTLEIENLFVFHSVGISDEIDGETDHIVLYRNLLYVIETKNKANLDSVYIDKEGIAYAKRTGQTFRTDSNKLTEKMDFYKNKYPNVTVKGILAVHYGTKKTGSEYKNCNVVALPRLMEVIVADISRVKPNAFDNSGLISDFARLCIRNELIP